MRKTYEGLELVVDNFDAEDIILMSDADLGGSDSEIDGDDGEWD